MNLNCRDNLEDDDLSMQECLKSSDPKTRAYAWLIKCDIQSSMS